MNFVGILLSSTLALAQSAVFVSSEEKETEINRLAVCPIVDNVSGIYGKPIGGQLKNWLIEYDRWTIVDCPMSSPLSPEQISETPQKAKEILNQSKADSLIMGRITKGPGGLGISLTLISGPSSMPFAEEQIRNYSGFELSDVSRQTKALLDLIVKKIPYDGKVLSRKGQMVTVNLGTRNNVKAGDELLVVQVVKLNRHPKFHFVISTEKEIMGKIIVDKSEEHLCFGSIQSERSAGVIIAGAKVALGQFIKYPTAGLSHPESPMAPVMETPSAGSRFGDGAVPWKSRSPAYGKISLQLGLGTYGVSNNLSTVGAVSSSANLVPSIHLGGEIWFNPQWYSGVELHQLIARMSNSYPASTPSSLSVSTNQLSLVFGYNFLMNDEFWGPKIQLYGGYGKMDFFVDQSTPEAFTSQQYSGLLIGVGGAFPYQWSEETTFTLGAKYNYYLNSRMSETPVSSGASTGVKISSFSLYATRPYSESIQMKADLAFDLYGTSFSGTGSRTNSASSASHSMTTLIFGIEYLF